MPVDLAGLERLIGRIDAAKEPDTRPLMFTWGRVIEEDNRKGVLAGTDRHGNPMATVEYRPKAFRRGKWWAGSADRRKDQRLGARKNAKRGVFGGFGVYASGLNNNLTRDEYELLDGPPLAPRRQFSRVITNLTTRLERDARDCRYVEGYWRDVVSVKGVAFLKYHFNGIGQKQRDLRGVRPAGMEKAKKSAVAWMLDILRTYGVKGRAA